MEKPDSEGTQGGESSHSKLKDVQVFHTEVAPDAYMPDPNIRSYTDTSDPAILKEMELQEKLDQWMPFHPNGSINRPSVTKWMDMAIRKRVGPALPNLTNLAAVREQIVHQLPEKGEAANVVFNSLLAMPQAVSSAKLSNHYYGFVSGGSLPIAEAANSLVGAMDLNVMVHDANTSVAVDVEAATLKMLLQVLNLSEDQWLGRTLTSGATGSNILALAAARDTLINRLLTKEYPCGAVTVAGQGLLSACAMVGIKNVKILSQKGHSSIYKTAGVLGLGRGSVVECGLKDEPWRWDWEKVEEELADDSAVCIAVVSCGEVDTGRYGSFGDDNTGDMMKMRYLMDATRHQGWIHVDGAFGIFARALPEEPKFFIQKAGVEGLQYADSIGADAHKCLNVPYESAFLFTRRAECLIDICSNGSAAYLATTPVAGIVSPLNISLENSRRFRALPIYAVLLNLGRTGLAKLFASQILLARAIAKRIHKDYKNDFVLLPQPKPDEGWKMQRRQIGIIVLFRAKDEELNKVLTDRINAHRIIFVSGTSYEGKNAVRIAVAGWNIDYSKEADGDAAMVCGVLDRVLAEWKNEKGKEEERRVDEKIGATITEKEMKESESENERISSWEESEGEGTKIWNSELDKVQRMWNEEMEKEVESEPFPQWDKFTMVPVEEVKGTLAEAQNAKQDGTPQEKHPSIVYVAENPFANVVVMAKTDAEQMRRAFDMGVPSFLESDVGNSERLEPVAIPLTPARCERERESARIKSPRTPHNPHAVHASRSPLAPHSLLLDPEDMDEDAYVDGMKGGEIQLAFEIGVSPFMVLTENVKNNNMEEPNYTPKRRERDDSALESPSGSRSPHSPHSPQPPMTTLDALD